MTAIYYSIVTNTGLAKLAAASAPGGLPVSLTHLAVGDSSGAYYEPSASATALQHELHRTATTYVVLDENNPNQLIVEAIIDETVGPFYVREVGVFDSDGALFAIGKFPETFKPNLPSGSGKRLYVRMILGFASAPEVSLTVSSQAINNDPNFSVNVFAALAQKLTKTANLSDVSDAVEARANLGLAIGTNVQAFGANLAALSALTGAASKFPYFTNAGQMGLIDLFSNRNAIINGSFNLWQRGTSLTNVAGGAYTVDRWQYYKNGSMVHDISRSTDVPTVAGAGRLFNYSLLIDCQTVDSSITTNKHTTIHQKIEGFNFAPLAQRQMSLSFWVKATKAGVYCVALQDSVSTRSCVKEFTINQSSVWEFKTLTFPASPSAGTWDYASGIGLQVYFTLAAGPSYNTAPDVWQSGNYISTANQVNACDSASNNFYLCGVQLEAGLVATPFEQRSIQQELELCQRYYESGQASFTIYNGQNNQDIGTSIYFKSTKRSAPTIALSFSYSGGLSNLSANNITADQFYLRANAATGQIGFTVNWNSDAEL